MTGSLKTFLDSEIYARLLAGVRAETNKYKVKIDRSQFAKSETETLLLKQAKSNYKAGIKSEVGRTKRIELIRHLVNVQTPQFNVVFKELK
jgi:GDP-D-mannose dehydratase